MPDSLTPLLACPRCDKALDLVPTGHRCAGCQVDFPSIGGIPWLFADPGTALGEWRGRLNFAIQKLDHDAAEITSALKAKDIHKLTRTRLLRLRSVTRDDASRLRNLLEPLEISSLESNYATYLALRTRLPSDQGLTTYYANVHRDWAWGMEENEASATSVVDALGHARAGKTLVLGAGAGRLAYDFHMRAHPDLTVAMDFNPLLTLVAKRVMQGDSIELYEFPIAPERMEDEGVLRTLKAEAPVRDGFFFVLADALRPPFITQSFDTVVTPWLIDILPEDFVVLARRINRLLQLGGRWINFGSLTFNTANPALRYTVNECMAILEECGFENTRLVEATIPYMCSPASRHCRRESVLTWTAEKKKKAERPPRHEALPDWLVKGEEPVPALSSFQAQALSTRVYAFIMSLIDGKRSLTDIANLMVEQRLMNENEAEPAIRSFLIRMYEDSQRSSRY